MITPPKRGSETAKACFTENEAKFHDDAEKQNLYTGLAHLALAVEKIGMRLDAIERALSSRRPS